MDKKFFCDLIICLSDLVSSGLKHPTNSSLIPLPVAKIGKTFHMIHGEVEFTEKTFDEFIKNFEYEKSAGLRDSLNLNYNHPALITNATPEQKKSAGDIKELVKHDFNGERYLIGWSEPTEAAASYIKKKEYKYISPEFLPEFFNKKTGKWEKSAWLRGAALLPADPQINLKISNFVTLSEQTNLNNNNSRGSKMDEQLKELLQKLGVVSFADGVSAIDNLKNVVKLAEEKIKSLESMLPKMGQKIVDAIMFDDAINMANKIKVERKAENEKKFETLFNKALEKGNVKPADKEFYQKAFFLSEDHSSIVPFAEKILSEKADATSINPYQPPQGGASPDESGKKMCFSDAIDNVQKRDKCDFQKAYQTARDENPELFENYRKSGTETIPVIR